ncbi:hypothetical protein DFH08DRAFT_797295 [Mycena albidolilacea]|uniref:Uncharacterized protein n=1 Tax=Mycena albidolilacea TaxID=1033008 RepID=A0AAD7F4A4_9AGAR|nr:hypothetical protein DFH08DRAFT_797295 [Mycena albidolilacea]
MANRTEERSMVRVPDPPAVSDSVGHVQASKKKTGKKRQGSARPVFEIPKIFEVRPAVRAKRSEFILLQYYPGGSKSEEMRMEMICFRSGNVRHSERARNAVLISELWVHGCPIRLLCSDGPEDSTTPPLISNLTSIALEDDDLTPILYLAKISRSIIGAMGGGVQWGQSGRFSLEHAPSASRWVSPSAIISRPGSKSSKGCAGPVPWQPHSTSSQLISSTRLTRAR